MNTVKLRAKRDYTVTRHHPWIFSGAVESVDGEPKPGETVTVADTKGAPLGFGSYSPASQIRVRMLSFNPAVAVDAALIADRVAAAVGRRADFLANASTDAFRVINAESDGLPGVVADVYAGHVVVQLATAGAEFWKQTLVDALMKFVPGAKSVFNRSDVDSRAHEGLEPQKGLLAGVEPPELVEIHEGEVKYLVDVHTGHKTGFYLDQRDARAQVAALSNGCDVLNCFSYTGGFGLACAAAGALNVTHLDLSAGALALAKKNADLNHSCLTKQEFLEGDVFKVLRTFRDSRKSFDLIVLDPPKFADTKSGLMKATRGYKDINLLAMKLLKPNGLLATFSCSGAVTPDLFEKVCSEAAMDAHRDFQIIGQTRQAADHPVDLFFPEGLYLKGLLLRALS